MRTLRAASVGSSKALITPELELELELEPELAEDMWGTELFSLSE